MGQSVSKPLPEGMRVGKPESYALGKEFDDWDFTFNGYAGTFDPAYPALLNTERETVTNSGDGDSATRTAVCNPCCAFTMFTWKGPRKVVRKVGNNRFGSLRTSVPDVRNVRSGRQHGTGSCKSDVQVRFQDRRRGRPSETIFWTW